MKRTFDSQKFSTAKLSRRDFIRNASGIAAGLGIAGAFPAIVSAQDRKSRVLPKPNKSGVEHIIVVMMENRSFDHFLGWLPGANGRQAGLTYLDSAGIAHSTVPLAPDYQGCSHPDPDHSYAGARIEYDNDACDGWLKAGSNDDFSI